MIFVLLGFAILLLCFVIADVGHIHFLIKQNKGAIMATKQEVLDAILQEKAEVTDGINKLNAQIQELKDQIAAGSPVTAADLDEIQNAVHDIFVV